jgi:ABC-type glycerol-3-phosphate transport system permease component
MEEIPYELEEAAAIDGLTAAAGIPALTTAFLPVFGFPGTSSFSL